MSTTHIQPLPNVRGRMSYTELGEGKKRTENIREKTNRIAAQMGDMGTREDFIRFCSAMRRQSQGTRLNEGYELRVSWSPEELSRDSPEDIQRACEYGYLLCKEVAPNAPCWVTVHTDGEGGCVHVHATIANHDLVSGTAIAHGTDHATVKRKNDRLSREGIEAYFEAKQRELETQEQDAPAPEVLPDVPETAEPAAQPSADSALDVYDLDRAYVSEMASDLQKAHIHRSREAGESFVDERYEALVEARNHPDEQRRRQREEAERRVYESRRSMWDAEKRLKAAEKALSNEDEREVRLKSERMQRRVKEAEQRAPVRTPRSADKDTQFGE